MENNNLPVIYGITLEPVNIGVQAYAIDGQTGERLESHFCSSEGFAKSDLGFTDGPIMDCIAGDKFNIHSTVCFHEQTRKTYAKKYPEGFRLEWIGFWENSDKVIELRKKQTVEVKW